MPRRGEKRRRQRSTKSEEEDENEDLIDAVKKRRPIWHINDPQHTNSVKVGHEWDFVCRDTGLISKFSSFNLFLLF